MSRYGGPRKFTAEGQLQRELQKVAEEIDRLYQLQQQGGPREWVFADALRASGPLMTCMMTPVVGSSGTTINLSLPKLLPAIFGLEVGIYLRNALGTVNVVPSFGATLNGTASVTITGGVGAYVLLATPDGWFTRRTL